MLGFISRIL